MAQSTSVSTAGNRASVMLDIVSLAARLGMAAVWMVTGYRKLQHPLQTKQAVNAYEILPKDLVPPLAAGLPAFEIALGILLLLGIFVRPVAVISLGVLAVFLCAIVSAWARGLSIDCGCFGGGGVNPHAGPATYVKDIVRDLGFVALSVWIVWRPCRRFAMHP